MPRSIKIICALLVFGVMVCKAQSTVEQSDQSAAAAANSDTANAIAVVGQPFSAIKYSRTDGHVQVRVGREGPYVTLSVKDDGIGMSPEDAAKVFDEFYRARN